MAHEQYCHIGWTIVRAMVVQLLVAMGSTVVHFEIAVKDFTFATVRAFASQTAHQRWAKRTILRNVLLDIGRIRHGAFHFVSLTQLIRFDRKFNSEPSNAPAT
jgi:hypothetical protein